MNEWPKAQTTMVVDEEGQIRTNTIADPDEQLREWVEQRQLSEPRRNIRLQKMKLLGLVVVLVVAVYGGGFLFIRANDDARIRELNATKAEQVDAADTIVTDWLEALRRGEDGVKYWSDKPWVQPSRLFSVRSWEIVNRKVDSLSAEFTIIIQSSLKMGTPISKTWKVELHTYDGDKMKITELKDLSDS